MPSTFRLSAARVLLTYSQVCENLTREAVLETIHDRYPIESFVIGEEQHADGGRHIHAALSFRMKVDSRDSTLFDINCGSTGCTDHHPNIKTVKRGAAHLARVQEYAAKEDPSPLSNVEPKMTWGEILQKAQDQTEYLDLVKKHYPRDYALSIERLEASAKRLFQKNDPNTITQYTWAGDELPPSWNQLDQDLPNWVEESPVTVIVGPPGCGKTTWAKKNAPKPALFIRHLDSLTKLTVDHKSIIFDDLCFKHMPVSTQKYLVDYHDIAEIHIRYRIGRIPANTPRLFTSNEFPFEQEGVHGEAIARRVKTVNLF